MIEWAPFAVRRDGPANKHGYANAAEPAHKVGLVAHSAVGHLQAMLDILDGSARKSWTFSNPKTGPLLQHYPAGFNCWANGNRDTNVAFVSIEHEGGPIGNESEPLTESQIANDVQLFRWLRDGFGWAGYTRRVELWEHNEMTAFGAEATACPSGRIPWDEIVRRIAAGTEPTREQQIAGLTLAANHLAFYGHTDFLPDADRRWVKYVAGRL